MAVQNCWIFFSMYICIFIINIQKVRIKSGERYIYITYTSILMCVKSHLDMNIDMYIVHLCSLS